MSNPELSVEAQQEALAATKLRWFKKEKLTRRDGLKIWKTF